MLRPLRRAYHVVMYYLSWVVFGAGGLALNLVCAAALPWRHVPAAQRRTRRVIRRLFDLWVRWFHATRIVEVRWLGFPAELAPGTVYVANHPSLIDAPVLLSRLPDAVCIFKPALMRNPAIGPAAILANYVDGGRGVEALRDAADRVAAGQALLVFPEGTRTAPGQRLGPLKPGYALIAQRARAPIQAITIRTSAGLVRRGSPWWRPPEVLPAWIEFTLGPVWPYAPAAVAADVATEVGRHLAASVGQPA